MISPELIDFLKYKPTNGNGEVNNLLTPQGILNAEHQLTDLHDQGLLDNNFYNDFTSWSSNQLLSLNTNICPIDLSLPSLLSLDPIGAFYESKNPFADNADTIAAKTPVILDAANHGMTAAGLTSLDTNHDGKLSGNELNSFNIWSDLNENGTLDADELKTPTQAGISEIKSSDYRFYTQGNSRYADSASTALPARTDKTEAVPDSNYRALRDTDNNYPIYGNKPFTWKITDIKINYNQKSYLIGTDGNDNFDAAIFEGWYSSKYFNYSLLTNFLGGNGDDSVGGSSRNDRIWGGTGNDYLYGYTGDDKLYGEEGDDSVQGQDGNDYLDGGTGNDWLFGYVGNDVLSGGDGSDLLLGFTPSNDTKQSLDAGESDDDALYGGRGIDVLWGGLGNDYLDGGDDSDYLWGDEGNDTLFGGSSDDQLAGGDGNDSLIGEAGDDLMFGEAGADTLWGGDGNDELDGDDGNDLLYGEADNDLLFGQIGDDVLYGGDGNDFLHGFSGVNITEQNLNAGESDNDRLYGESGDDFLFGQVGDDILYGGDGDDLLVGFTGTIETKQTLNAGESDNDWLYGGAGSDTLLGGFSNDYLDGGAGADTMEGGAGDDIYIVNSVNDNILEQANEGYDKVISNVNYLLNANIEELRLVEGPDINGTGNALSNTIIGNSRDNILDGVTGADTMIGGAGNDTYYVDNLGDQTIELAGEGVDTVQSTISHTLGGNLENLILLDFSKPEKGYADGEDILVYGYPKANELDYTQGDAVPSYRGTCALTSIANLLTQIDRPTTETQVVQVAIDNQWTVTDPEKEGYERGATSSGDQQRILDSYGIRNDLLPGYNEAGVANLIRSGRGVIIGVNAGSLWGDAKYVDYGGVNHAVTLTGAVYGAQDGALMGFYIADSGRHKVSDMTRYISIDDFQKAANVSNAYAIYTIEPLKMWDENIDGYGNELNNVIVGNRGDNLLGGKAGSDTLEGGAGHDTLDGGAGADTLDGGAGNDTYAFGRGYGQDTVSDRDNAPGDLDTVQMLPGVLPADVTLSRDIRNLYLKLAGTTDQITLSNWFTSANTIEQVKFADGTVWDKATLQAKAQALGSTGAGVPDPTPPPTSTPTPEQVFQDAAATFTKNNTHIAFSIDADGTTHLSYTTLDGTANRFDTAPTGSYSVSQTPKDGLPSFVTNDPANPGHGIYIIPQAAPATNGSGISYNFGGGITVTQNADGTSQYQIPLATGGSFAIQVDGSGTRIKIFDAGGTLVSQASAHFDASGNYTYTPEPLPAPPAVNTGSGSTLGLAPPANGSSIFTAEMEQAIRAYLATNPTPVQVLTDAASVGFTVDQLAAAENLVAGAGTYRGSDVVNYINTNMRGQFTVGQGGIILVYSSGFSAEMEQAIRAYLATNPSPEQILADAASVGFTVDQLAAAKNLVAGAGTYIGSDVVNYINTNMNGKFSVGPGGVIIATPIVFDLDGNGVSLVPLALSTATFDFDGSGARLRTGWAASSDALLAYDADGNGKIDHFNEISFTGYLPGATTDLEGLAAFDTNHDGKLTAQDALWSKLQLWQDKNQDGISDAGELTTLAGAGIIAIGLESNHQERNLDGNVIFGTTYFTRADGSTGLVGDVKFDYAPPGRTATGTNATDVLTGSEGDDHLESKAGDDVLIALGGNDLLDGGSGADTMIGGAGNDTYLVDETGDRVLEKPGEGIDTVRATVSYSLPANVEVLELAGSANIDATGNDLANRLIGNDGANTLMAMGGNDTLIAGKGIARMIGGAGDDTYLVNNAADQVIENPGEGNDLVIASVNFVLADNAENLILAGTATQGTGNALNNILTGNHLGNQLIGGAGDDVLLSGNGSDTLDGGAGADTMAGSGGGDTYLVDDAGDIVKEKPGEGFDTVRASISYALSDNVENLILGGNANIDGAGNGLANRLIGNAGNNLLDAGAGADTMIGGAGDDTYLVDNGGDAVTEQAGEGSDTVYSAITYALPDNIEKLVLSGSSSHDGSGNALDNVLVGNRSGNFLDGGAGADTMVGGVGDDTYMIDNVGDAVIEGAGEGFDTVVAAISHALADDVENLALSGGANIDGAGNRLANRLLGNAGNNLLDAGAGADTMIGGAGDDIYRVDNVGDAVTEQAGEGSDTVYSAIAYALPDNIEKLVLTGSSSHDGSGNAIDNVLVGNRGGNVLDGGAGADTLVGGAGDDTYMVDDMGDAVSERADEGDDTVVAGIAYVLPENVESLALSGTGDLAGSGNRSNNLISGNAGNNRLDGGAGRDMMIGGGGDDTYYVDNIDDIVKEEAGEGTDTIVAGIHYALWGLPGNVENLILTGTGDLAGSGNALDNAITGNAGNNLLDGGLGADTMAGGSGNDTYIADNSGDRVVERADEGLDTVRARVSYALSDNVENLVLTGNRSLTGTGNALANVLTAGDAGDTLIAGAGADRLLGGAGQDVLDGGNGGDFLDGGIGSDLMSGGAGDDLYRVDHAGDRVLENPGEGTDLVESSISHALAANLENLTLTGSADIDGSGNELDNLITGNSGRNILTGLAGNDTYVVDNPGDVVVEYGDEGEDGDDEEDGDGDDDHDEGAHGDGYSGEMGIDTVLAAISYVLAASLENLTLTGGADLNGSGNGWDNVIFGNAGNNFLDGGAGNDTISGGDGVDVLSGGSGDDILRAGPGNGILLGGNGDDTLTALAGNHFFAGGKQDDVITTGAGHNVVAFNHGDRNDIVLPSLGASNTLSLGGGIEYDSLAFAKHGADLVLDAGGNNSVIFKGWYADAANRNFVTLQVIDEAHGNGNSGNGDGNDDGHGNADNNGNSDNGNNGNNENHGNSDDAHDNSGNGHSAEELFTHKVEIFDFTALVAYFDQARAANPDLGSWRLMDALPDTHLSGSDTAALGGDPAYAYGMNNGALDGLSPGEMQEVAGSALFGSQQQTLRPWASLAGDLALFG